MPKLPPQPTPGDASGDDDVARAGSYILPGGKVDADAIRRALDASREAGKSGEDVPAEAGDDDEELRRVTFELKRDLKTRLDKYLVNRIGFMSRNQLQKLIDDGGVWVNDKPPKASTVLRAGDVVEVIVPPPPASNIQPEDIPLDVLFEDEHLVVVNKQPDIIVHPARSHLKGTMLSALAFHFRKSGGELSKVGHEFARPGVVHRLDRHTSGCIVFAKQDEAHWKLGHQFEHRRVDKRYLAVVHGKIEPDTDVINLPIGNHPSREKGYREKYVVRHDELGKQAVTIYRVRERYRIPVPANGAPSKPRPTGSGQSAGAAPEPWAEAAPVPSAAATDDATWFTLVELELKTGRTHQIRVHLSHNFWPIVGDDMYGGKAVGVRAGASGEELVQWNAEGMGKDAKTPEGVRPIITRQALHACVLGFTHPISEKPMAFTAPLRGDIGELVALLRRLSGGGERVDVPGATVDLGRALGLGGPTN